MADFENVTKWPNIECNKMTTNIFFELVVPNVKNSHLSSNCTIRRCCLLDSICVSVADQVGVLLGFKIGRFATFIKSVICGGPLDRESMTDDPSLFVGRARYPLRKKINCVPEITRNKSGSACFNSNTQYLPKVIAFGENSSILMNGAKRIVQLFDFTTFIISI